MDPSVASFGPFRRTVGPPRVATMSRPACGTTTARNDACSLVQPLITHGKRQMEATSGHPFSEASCVGDAVAALKPVISLQDTTVNTIPSRRYGVGTP